MLFRTLSSSSMTRMRAIAALSVSRGTTDTLVMTPGARAWLLRLAPVMGALSIAGLVAGCGARPTVPSASQPAPDRVRVRVLEAGGPVIREVPLEEYVAASALSEFSPAAGDEAAVERMLEVQAVLARSYAVSHLGRHVREGYDLCSTTHCQIYDPARMRSSRWSADARTAAARTSGMTIWYEGAPADAVYHADCGGHTSAAVDVWGAAALPYLRAQPDDGPAAAAHAAWRYAVDRDALRRALNADRRTMIGDRLDVVSVVGRDEAGRAQRVLIKGDAEASVRGTDFREVVTAAFGPRALRSTMFQIVPDGGQFVFTGSGFGHGVGLCQAGAFARISAGAAPGDVLALYYPGTVLVRLR